ncbi:MAG: presenilin family intramembrane aspartyl protease [Candidatus Bathyarchaeota archaeon]|nr:presenilin family intramembrane aspartyl protease [Candidatus Bathyarchaeota archaeon]
MSEPKTENKTEYFSVFMMAGLFVVIHLFSMLMTQPFEATGLEVFENPDDPTNIIVFFVTMLAVTVTILLIAKFWKKGFIQVIILGSIAYTSFFVFYIIFAYAAIADTLALILAIAAAGLLVLALLKHPEWYVINFCGIIVGVGAISIFSISLSILLIIILLIGLAVYDAISVYKTKHMIDLADAVMDLKLPVMLVVPKTREYSILKETQGLKEKIEEKQEREAFFMGLGDIVMPGILVAASFYQNIAGNGLLVALSVMIGTLVGFVALMSVVLKGKPQAGLPFLCSGAILGYLVSSFLLSGTLIL